MKNMNDEIRNLSMADDENDYDEYEEEVIERDEEYDDDEDYDEEYDDEEYEDEDYEDEEDYDEEEPYDEEYDDGYDDQYYDDRLNKVLDELAELKRGMTPAVAQPQYSSVQPHLLFTMPQQNNEVAMYNEISRLRDELSKTQNTQSLHVELSKLKEDMERDKHQNENRFLEEIKRLNERIEELQQPEKSKAIASSANNGTAGYLEAPRMPTKELNKLIGISESLLHNTSDSDSRIISEISELKNQVNKLPDSENINKILDEIRETVKLLEKRPETSEDTKAALAEISSAIATLKKSSEENIGNGIDKKLLNKLSRMNVSGGGVDLTEIMRSVYELKGMLGSNDQNQQSLVNMALKVYTDLDLLHATIANSPDFRAKLEAVDNFVNAVNSQDYITSDAFDAYNIVLKNLMDTPLERSVFDAVCSFASATGKITVNSAKKDAVAKYISFAERAKREEIDNVLEFLPEMISVINDAEGAKNVSYNSTIYSDIQDIVSERNAQTDESKKRSDEAEIKALIGELTSLKIGDVVTFNPTMPLPTSNALTFVDGDSVSDRLNVLLQSVERLEQLIGSVANTEKPTVGAQDDIAATADAPIVVESASGDVTESLESLKSMLLALNAKVDLDDFADGLRQSLAGITNRLSKIESNLSAGGSYESPAVENTVADENETVAEAVPYENYSENMGEIANEIVDRIGEKLDSFTSDDNREAVSADLEAIKDKLAEQDSLLEQIGELRADILTLPESLNSTTQFDKLYDDIVAQFDKLYDDLSAFDGDLSDKINERLTEIKSAVDSITASDLSSAILDGIVDFRTSYEENQSLSSEDRNKILEDLAFVKEQVQTKLSEQAEGITNDEISAQIKTLGAEFADNLGVIESKISALKSGDTLITEQYNQVSDKFVGLNANLDSANEILNELKEKSSALEDMITANGLLVADNQNAITDELNRILEQLTPPQTEEEQSGVNVYDEIVAISDKVTQLSASNDKANEDILAALAEIKEQVHLKELEQNLAAVSATEEEQQTLLKEIATLRERLSGLETQQKEQADNADAQLAYISDQITVLVSDSAQESEETADGTVDEIKAISDDIAEIKDKLFRGASDDNALNMQVLLSDVADIKERLNADIETSSDFVKMSDDLTFIRNQIEANMDTSSDDDNLGATLENEGLSLIMDDIAAIKEKLASFDEYDTVAEILSLREDVKSARILDNNDVAAELEGLKSDLSELKADISDIKALKVDSENVSVGGPTGDEVNMLLSEIVSLRDEIQDYKDDVANIITAEHDDQQPVTAVADENIAVILDELNGLHNELAGVREENFAEQADEIDEIKGVLAEIKDMIARRTTLPEEGVSRDSAAVSNELNVVLDEIINLKDEISALKTDFTTINENVAAERESDEQAEKAVFADELSELKSELYAMVSQKIEEIASGGFAVDELHEELQGVKDQLADLQALAIGGVAVSDDGETGTLIAKELNEIKEMLANRPEVEPVEQAISIEDLYAEMTALRQEIEASKLQQPVVTNDGNISVDLTPINEQLTAIREQLISSVPAAEADETVLNEVLVLRDEVAALKEQLANVPIAETESEPDTVVLGEILSLREELTALREQMTNVPVAVSGETDEAVLTEVLSLREELAALREQINGGMSEEKETEDTALLSEIVGLREEVERLRDGAVNSDETASLMETVDAIKEDIRAIKEEPDLSIINEVLALRDEFQAFKDELNKTRTVPAEDKSKSELVAEVQSLRDQLFAISMANVNDGTSNEVVYESYNNIILDEISALRDEIAILKQSDETRMLADELSQMKDKLTNLAVDDSEKTEARFEEIRKEIADLKRKDESDVANNTILAEIASLKEDFANQREADATTLNFMSEMAKQLERRDSGINQSSTERLTDEIESLKDEIAASLAADFSVSDIKKEIESLKDVLKNTKTEAAVIDNSDVLKELATLKKEIDKQNSSHDTKQILKEIARLKDDIGVIAEKEPGADADLSRSINDLKAELNQIAEFVDDGENSKPQPKKKSSGSRSKTSSKSGAKRKTPSKPAAEKSDELSGEELLSKIDATKIDAEGFDDNTLVMNPRFEQPQEIPATSVEMDIASRLAKQVANKLIMEQLVQQLGDGGVPQSEVEEIVKDILPQEFATIQIDEQTDKVRRLANSLVLDKLRSRLRK